jgi:hypothetical protein
MRVLLRHHGVNLSGVKSDLYTYIGAFNRATVLQALDKWLHQEFTVSILVGFRQRCVSVALPWFADLSSHSKDMEIVGSVE